MKKCLLIFFVSIVFIPQIVNAQFEHRFSATLSGGYLMPFGVRTDIIETEVLNPYLFANFSNGVGVNFGLHLNTGKVFSLSVFIDYLQCGSWDYSYDDYFYDPSNNKDIYLDILNTSAFGLGLAPRLYFNPKSKVRVYAMLEISANYLKVTKDGDTREDIFGNRVTKPEEVLVDNVFAVGVSPNIGLDIRITERAGIFIQHGLSMLLFNDTYIEDWYDLRKDNLNVFRVDLGLRFNFLKSKKI